MNLSEEGKGRKYHLKRPASTKGTFHPMIVIIVKTIRTFEVHS